MELIIQRHLPAVLSGHLQLKFLETVKTILNFENFFTRLFDKIKYWNSSVFIMTNDDHLEETDDRLIIDETFDSADFLLTTRSTNTGNPFELDSFFLAYRSRFQSRSSQTVLTLNGNFFALKKTRSTSCNAEYLDCFSKNINTDWCDKNLPRRISQHSTHGAPYLDFDRIGALFEESIGNLDTGRRLLFFAWQLLLCLKKWLDDLFVFSWCKTRLMRFTIIKNRRWKSKSFIMIIDYSK